MKRILSLIAITITLLAQTPTFQTQSKRGILNLIV